MLRKISHGLAKVRGRKHKARNRKVAGGGEADRHSQHPLIEGTTCKKSHLHGLCPPRKTGRSATVQCGYLLLSISEMSLPWLPEDKPRAEQKSAALTTEHGLHLCTILETEHKLKPTNFDNTTPPLRVNFCMKMRMGGEEILRS